MGTSLTMVCAAVAAPGKPTGQIKDAGGLGLSNVAVALSGTAARTVYTDSDGFYLLPSLPAGTYQVTPSRAGAVFSPAKATRLINTNITLADFAAPGKASTLAGRRATRYCPQWRDDNVE